MLLRNRRTTLGIMAVLGGLTLSASACLISIDEGLIDKGKGGAAGDAGTDGDASVTPEGGDAKPEADVLVTETGPDADPDVNDASEELEADIDAEPDADDAADAPDADDAADAGDAAEGGSLFDGPLAQCYDDTWCPPVGCSLRRCEQGTCVAAGTMKEDVTKFDLPTTLACNHGTNRTCVVAVRNYVVALTDAGLVVFNTRNPLSVRQETIPNNIGANYRYLVRSGERVWAVKESVGDSSALAWLEVPLDGVGLFSPPSTTTVYVSALSARHAAPNDAILLYHRDSTPEGYVSSYKPGLPTTLASFLAQDAVEPTAMASSGSRLLLQERVEHTASPTTYRHHFSLQSDVLSSQSTNSGTYEETTLTNTHNTSGYFASSRTGAIAWVIGRYDSTPEWRDVRAYWLVANDTAPIDSVNVVIETYITAPPSTPEGPLAFINDDTIATAVISGGASPSPTLDIVRRAGGAPPSLVKRISTSPLAPGALNVAGDAGFAYVVTGTTVRMFAPSCQP